MAIIYSKKQKKLLTFIKFFNIWFLFYDCLLKQSLIAVTGGEVFLLFYFWLIIRMSKQFWMNLYPLFYALTLT